MSKEKFYKSIKYRIFPTDEQKVILNEYFGARRWCWNYLHNLIFNTDYMQNTEKHAASKISLRNHIRKNGPEWIAEGSKRINVTLVENTAEDFSIAYGMYYKKAKLFLKEARIDEATKYKPKYKTKKESKQSFSISKKNDTSFRIIDGKINVNMTKHVDRQTFYTKKNIKLDIKSIKRVVFHYSNGKYYMGIVYEIQVPEKPYISGSRVGIDLGLKTAAVCYDGDKYFEYNIPDMVEKLKLKRNKIASKFYKSKKYSKNSIRLLKRLRKAYKRTYSYRDNWQDHIVNELCKKYETIIIDEMPVLGKGPKTHNTRKTSIAVGRFMVRFNLKSEELQNSIIVIKPGTPTTQTCSNCGNIKQKDEKLKLYNRTYKCSECGHEQDRDENAAKNVYNYNYK